MDKEVSLCPEAERTCLKCGKEFRSSGPGNRICKKCTRINARFGPIPEAVLAKQRGSKRHNGFIIDDTADVLPD